MSSGHELRVRATALRSLASRLGRLRALEVVRLAGPDTWVGPSPEACRVELLAVRRSLQRAGDDLRATAHWLERRADESDAATLRRS